MGEAFLTGFGKTGDKRYTTFVVGAMTSGHKKSDVDYLCNGTADDVTINAAIAALPATGGKILIREGTYLTNNQILINKPNVVFEGMGNSTIIKRATANNPNGQNIIRIENDYVELNNLYLDMNYTIYDSTNVDASVIYSLGNYVKIQNVTCTNNCNVSAGISFKGSYGVVTNCVVIYCYPGISVSAVRNDSMFIDNIYENIVSNNITRNCYIGIRLTDSKNSIIDSNICSNDKIAYGILVDGYAENIIVTNNRMSGANVGNGADSGIYVIPNYCTICNNIITGYSYGIKIDSTGSIVTSNYSSAISQTMYFDSDSANNVCLGNVLKTKNVLNQGTENLLVNNKVI